MRVTLEISVAALVRRQEAEEGFPALPSLHSLLASEHREKSQEGRWACVISNEGVRVFSLIYLVFGYHQTMVVGIRLHLFSW